MIAIDGSEGEGGGQVLRTALGLSIVTGRPFRVENIRAGRRSPGLMRQHLTAVEAACAVGGARCGELAIGATEISFVPDGLVAGDHEFAVGTAGSTCCICSRRRCRSARSPIFRLTPTRAATGM